MATFKPLTRQIADQIRLQIARGHFMPESKLPSLRTYAQLQGVAKNTVVQAFELLVEEGVLEPRRGSGYYVTGARGAPLSADSWAPALDQALAAVGIDRSQFHALGGSPSMGDGLPPSEWLSTCRLDRYMQKIGRSGLGTIFRYGDPFGYLPLRQSIARKLDAYGIRAQTDQIILTQGSYQAVDIVIRRFVRSGDAVLIDVPGFYPTYNKLRLQGANIVGIPRNPDGPDLAALSRAIKKFRPRLFLTQSTGHNPTGSDITKEAATEVMSLASQAGMLVLDDDALADFKPPRCLRLARLDREFDHSIYVGSFSKSLSSVVRVGFLVCAPALARELVEVKTTLSLNSSPYAERTVEAVITEGRFERHVVDLQNRARRATQYALAMFEQHGATVFCSPQSTLFLWARLPGINDATAFAKRLLERGITLAPGAIFQPDSSQRSPWFRFNVGFMECTDHMEAVWDEIGRWK
ncbi:PLP-dependent aminotransferase family protein [Bordetella petrii]|uniref:aminotransferase-like domain-containing protein n=1 Tax=Bordetella petrii TaxID=94624 RepID=UPI001E57DBA8|nr:PLP-dependent aminotransferase family protein [Bordetella petrii]MCD0502012.1 PLP-dependent aminotransferase family protein [Bordetella petrii]